MIHASPLEALVRDELFGEAPEAAEAIARQVHHRFGPAVAAVVFYGSCLRKQSAEGVLDLYVVVDDYRSAYGSRALAFANALLPPNVFYVETCDGETILRAKYAVISRADLERAVGPTAIRPGAWARFCQPVRAVYARDEEARRLLALVAARSIRTAVLRGLGLLPRRDGASSISPESFWQGLFRETYASELRPEREENIRALYFAAPERYVATLRAVLAELDLRGVLQLTEEDGGWRLEGASALLGRPQRARRWLAKAIGGAQLLKSAVTFGDWLPYALWKLERHTGTRLEPTPRQRRHPLLFAWPLIFRALARRDLK